MKKKILIIGGNRYVGLRVSKILSEGNADLHIVNRRGVAPHIKNAAIYKSNRLHLHNSSLDKDWDAILDFACYNEKDAKSSLAYFENVKRYILISTSSVYELGRKRLESDFDASSIASDSEHALGEYACGKRNAERAFAKNPRWPLVSVRFPFILGPDDYTGRLEFHTKRIAQNQMIYVPNPNAEISVVSSEDAAKFLVYSLEKTFTGPVNVASPDAITLRDLFNTIALLADNKIRLTENATESNQSPYGVESDASLNVDRCLNEGFQPLPQKQWLPQLIHDLLSDGAAENTKKSIH